MKLNFDLDSVLEVATLLSIIIACLRYAFSVHDWARKQDFTDAKVKEDVKMQNEKIAEIKEEQCLLVYGTLACLKGLKEQGCNGPVTEAINKIEKHINEKAHDA